MNYSEAIEKAWKIIWRFKILWVLGLLASCSGGTFSTPSFNYNFQSRDFPGLNGGNAVLSQIAGWFYSIPIWIWIVLALGGLTLGLLLFFVGLVGRAGVIRGAWLADTGAESLSLGDLIKESLGYFWRMLGLTLLVGLPGFLFAILSLAFILGGILSTFASSQPGAAGIAVLLCIGLPMFCLIIPLSWLLSMLSELCSTALVGENLGVFASLKRGWDLLWKKLGSAVLVSILLFVGRLAIGIVLSIPAVLVVVPVVFAAIASKSVLAIGLGIIALGVLAGLVGLFVNSVFHAYSGSLWTLTFRRLTIVPVNPAAPVPPVDIPAPAAPLDLPPAV